MDYERIRNGEVPPDVASDPAKLIEYAKFIRANDPDFDEAAMLEWVGVVKSRVKPTKPTAAPKQAPQKTGMTSAEAAAIVEQTIRDTDMSKMSNAESSLFRQKLMKVEHEMNIQEVQEAVAMGMPLPRQRPRGSILNHLIK